MPKKTLTQKVFEFLKKGGSVKAARNKWPKKGAILSNAIQQYLEWVSPQIDEWQKKAAPLQSMNTRLENEIRVKNREITLLNKQLAHKEKTNQELQQTSEQLEKTIIEKKKDLQTLQHTLSEMNKQRQTLQKKGINPTLIAQIHSMEVESGEDLLTRVTTAQTYTHTKRQLQAVTKELTQKNVECHKMEKTLRQYRDDITFTKNELDQAQKATSTYQEAVDITEAFLADGYSISNLKQLRAGLKGIALKGKPQQSVHRLIQGL